MTKLETDAIQFAKTGHYADFIACLDAGVSPDTVDESSVSMLMYAARRGHKSIVAELLRRGANKNHVGLDGTTALSRAQQMGLSQIAALIQQHDAYRKGYDIEKPLENPDPWKGYCALFDAIWNDFENGRELNEYEYAFLAPHPYMTCAMGWGFEDMLVNRGYQCVPDGIRLFDAVNEPRHASILRYVDEIVRRHANQSGYDLEKEVALKWEWDAAFRAELETFEEEQVKFYEMPEDEHIQLARKTLNYLREHRQHFTNAKAE